MFLPNSKKRKALLHPLGNQTTFRCFRNIYVLIKGEAERGLCNSKPRQGEVLRPMGSTSRDCTASITAVLTVIAPERQSHGASPTACNHRPCSSPMPLHLHGSGFFSQRQRVILRLLPFMLLVHYDQQRPAFRGKRAGAS